MQPSPLHFFDTGIQRSYMHYAYTHIIQQYARTLLAMMDDIHAHHPTLRTASIRDPDGHIWYRGIHTPDKRFTIIQPYTRTHPSAPTDIPSIMQSLHHPQILGPSIPGGLQPRLILMKGHYQPDTADIHHTYLNDRAFIADIHRISYTYYAIQHSLYPIKHFMDLMQSCSKLSQQRAEDIPMGMEPDPHVYANHGYRVLDQILNTAIQQDGTIPGTAVTACLSQIYEQNIIGRANDIVDCAQYILAYVTKHPHTIHDPYRIDEDDSVYIHPKNTQILVFIHDGTQYTINTNATHITITNQRTGTSYNLTNHQQQWSITQRADGHMSRHINKIHEELIYIRSIMEDG